MGALQFKVREELWLQEGDLVVVDPSMKEEAAAEGFVSVVLNAHNELCLLSKSGGIGLPPSQVDFTVDIAALSVFSGLLLH